MTTVPSEEHEYYATATYWNQLPTVIRRLNERATGDPDEVWYQFVHRQGRHFDRALILNCGNGWVEMDLLAVGLVDSVVGIDIDEGLLQQARDATAAAGFDATYVVVDINTDPLPDGPFDLVVNHAAGHHIASIDRVMRSIAERMTPDGLFVHWDYVGAHRNQFDTLTWERAEQVNETLPAELRQRLVYPHLATMLVQDPTEAIHSELIVPTLERYFHIDLHRPLGGGVGYLLLTHNPAIYDRPPASIDDVVERVMDADQQFLDEFPDRTLFAFIMSRPRAAGAHDASVLARWTQEEELREAGAQRAGGEYYPPTEIASRYYGRDEPAADLPAPAVTAVATSTTAAMSADVEAPISHGQVRPRRRTVLAARFPRLAGVYRRAVGAARRGWSRRRR